MIEGQPVRKRADDGGGADDSGDQAERVQAVD